MGSRFGVRVRILTLGRRLDCRLLCLTVYCDDIDLGGVMGA